MLLTARLELVRTIQMKKIIPTLFDLKIIYALFTDSPKFRVTRARIQSRSQQKALEVLQESTQHMVVDRERLVRLLDTTVEVTEDYNVSRLEKLHSIFSQCIYQHRLDADKTQLIQVNLHNLHSRTYFIL